MPYNEELAERVRAELGGVKKVTEMTMFGGLGFMVAGNMACGVNRDDVIVRVGPDLHQDALTRPNAREMDLTGRPMKGFVAVGPASAVDDAELGLWVKLGVAYATSLPAKKPAKKAAIKKKTKAAPKKAAPKKKAAAKKKSVAKKTAAPKKAAAKKLAALKKRAPR